MKCCRSCFIGVHVGIRGGKITVKTDPSNQIVRLEHPLARPFMNGYGFYFLIIQISSEPRVLCFCSGGYPTRPTNKHKYYKIKNKNKNPKLPTSPPTRPIPTFPSSLFTFLILFLLTRDLKARPLRRSLSPSPSQSTLQQCNLSFTVTITLNSPSLEVCSSHGTTLWFQIR